MSEKIQSRNDDELLQKRIALRPGGKDFEQAVTERVNAFQDQIYQNKSQDKYVEITQYWAARFAELERHEQLGILDIDKRVEYEALKRIIHNSQLEIDLSRVRSAFAKVKVSYW
ncbi:MAG TPA: hypothetical protein VLH19_00680 [Patescibacteria group bacterium]|nr:hypothetical protein [Patescibacteria group bacterium]